MINWIKFLNPGKITVAFAAVALGSKALSFCWLVNVCQFARQSNSHNFLMQNKEFMLKRAAEEPLGHAAAIITDVLENAETNQIITAAQKRSLLQDMAPRLS
ncbi:hypothetical protein ACLOJK_038499 [Asimina triloba]